jgi:hypothetical protein
MFATLRHFTTTISSNVRLDVVSRTEKDLVAGSGTAFEDRGLHRLKGIPDERQPLAAT